MITINLGKSDFLQSPNHSATVAPSISRPPSEVSSPLLYLSPYGGLRYEGETYRTPNLEASPLTPLPLGSATCHRRDARTGKGEL